MKKQILMLLAIFMVGFNANAIVELRAGYGIQTPSDDNYSGNTLKTLTGFNIDAILELPMVPFGFGLRYENMGFDLETSPTTTFESEFQRTSLLVNYRIIDLFAYFGLIGTLGLVNDLTVTVPGFTAAEFDASMTYSVGVEGGVSFGMLMLGAELGYIAATLEQTNDPTNSDIELDGVYAKAIVGVGF